MTPIHASGGLLLRPGDGGVEVLVVHRPRYDDWSLPKGKDDPGESPEAAALREVAEETGYRARIVAPLGEVEYRTADGRPKRVVYFAMRPVAGTFRPNREVDEARWLDVETAAELLTHPGDRRLVREADLDALVRTGRLFLVRHAAAGNRARWTGDDHLRPLTAKGRRQAERIARRLAPEGIERILTSPYVRCRQTVEPLAAELDLEVEEVDALAEGSPQRAVVELADALAGTNAVLCGHGDTIPALLDGLAAHGMELPIPYEVKKGSIWVVDVEAGRPRRATYEPPPEA